MTKGMNYLHFTAEITFNGKGIICLVGKEWIWRLNIVIQYFFFHFAHTKAVAVRAVILLMSFHHPRLPRSIQGSVYMKRKQDVLKKILLTSITLHTTQIMLLTHHVQDTIMLWVQTGENNTLSSYNHHIRFKIPHFYI